MDVKEPFIKLEEYCKEPFIKLEEYCTDIKECYAHISASKLFTDNQKTQNYETIEEHIKKCEKYWNNLFNDKCMLPVIDFVKCKFGIPDHNDIFKTLVNGIVTFHDAGKINPNFQMQKMENKNCNVAPVPNASINTQHSILSASMYQDYFLAKINHLKKEKEIADSESELLKDFVYIFAWIISRHHSNMNSFEQYINSFSGLDGTTAADAYKWLSEFNNNRGNKTAAIRKRWGNMWDRLKLQSVENAIILYGFARILYSLLLASDYYATTEYMNGTEIDNQKGFENLDEMITTYENTELMKHIRDYQTNNFPLPQGKWNTVTDMNILRNELFLEAEQTLLKNMDKSIFYLEAPTGSGKSNVATNLAFQMAKKDTNIQKIIYVYPFNTLVEQNMENLKKIFGHDEKIMENIAVVNSVTEMPVKNESDWSTTLLDRQFLNYPFTLTSSVSLFNTLFGNRKEDCFGFYQLRNSVIVLDEIQNYPIDIWCEIIRFLKDYAKLLHIKIIIMSATLPDLDILAGERTDSVKLIMRPGKYFTHSLFKDRVGFDYSLLDEQISLPALANIVAKHAGKKVLIEFFKKKSARAFYHILKEKFECSIPVFLLTGNSNRLERKNTLDRVKQDVPVFLITTQVVESGVDIDMDIGFKDVSRLDSEEQLAGRINRSCLKKDSNVYFFHYDNAKDIYINDYRADDNNTILNKEVRALFEQKDFQTYYQDKIMQNLLTKKHRADDNNVENFFHDSVGCLDFMSVAEKMKIITGNQETVPVFFSRCIKTDDEEIIDGSGLWDTYKNLLLDNNMSFAEKKIKMHNLRAKMNFFIMELDKKIASELLYSEKIGDVLYVEEGERFYDENGMFKYSELEKENLFC